MPKILVVDDETNIVILCQQLLETAGYTVLPASDAHEALALAEIQPVDLLLTDIRMPTMDGFELAEKVKTLQPEVAIVLMTGYRTVETAIQALRSGVDGLAIKPYDLGSELPQIIQRALQQSQNRLSSIRVEKLRTLNSFSAISLIDKSAGQYHQLIVKTLQKLFAVQDAGVYLLSNNGDFQLLYGEGTLPAGDSEFWQKEELRTEKLQQKIGPLQESPDWNALLSANGWCSLLLVTSRWRAETYLFLAAQRVGQPSFWQSDLDLLAVVANQAAVMLENIRLFEGMSTAVRRIEGADGALLQAGRMTNVQRLLPPLLHELNTPLQGVKNGLTLSARGGLSPDRLRSYLNMAQQELYRLENILQQVLLFAQPGNSESATIDCEQLVTQVIEIMQIVFKERNIQIRLNINRPLPAVVGSRDQLEQVLFSVLFNAVDALEDVQGERVIWVDLSAEQNRIRIRVEDNGAGVAADTAARLFRPFTSTRPGQNGLGLAVSLRNLQALGGTVKLVPMVHASGASFLISLPASPDQT